MLPALMAAGSLALRYGPLVLGMLPIVKDAMKKNKEPTPEALAQITGARDKIAMQIATAEGIPLEQAKAHVAEILKPVLDKAMAPTAPEDTTMDKVIDAGGLVGDVMVGGAMLKGAGKLFGKGAKAAKAASTEAAATAKSGAPLAPAAASADASYSPGFKSSGRMAAEAGALDRVEPMSAPKFGGHLTGPGALDEPVRERQGVLVPPDGGHMPMDPDMGDLFMRMLAARKQGSPPPGAFRAPPLGISMTPETGRALDVRSMRGRLYGNDGG